MAQEMAGYGQEAAMTITDTQDAYLLTLGPLTTSRRTKEAMLRDWGSWDGDFNAVTADIRRRLVAMCDGGDAYDCVLMQGGGTFSVEAALGSFIPKFGKVLVLMNGAYGQRAGKTLDYLGRGHVSLDKGDYLPPLPEEVARTQADRRCHELVWCGAAEGAGYSLRGHGLVRQQMHRRRAGVRLHRGEKDRADRSRRRQSLPQSRSARRVGPYEPNRAMALYPRRPTRRWRSTKR
jgi:hypothetical protein